MITQKKYDKLKSMLIAQRKKNRIVEAIRAFTDGTAAAKYAIKAMADANDVQFTATPSQMTKLSRGFSQMIISLGGSISQDSIDQIADGDVDELDDKYANIKGWKIVNKVLNDAFDAYDQND